MQKLSRKLQKATAWLLAMGMTLSAIQPTMAYADTETSDPAVEVTSGSDTGSGGYTSIDIQASKDDSSILDVKTSNTKDSDQEIRLHLWEFDEGFFEDYEFTKTPEKNVTINSLDETNTTEITTKSGEVVSLDYIIDAENSDYYISFTAQAQTEYEFNINFEDTKTVKEAIEFVVEPEIVDAGEDDQTSEPVKLTMPATTSSSDQQSDAIKANSNSSKSAQESKKAKNVQSTDINTYDESADNKCGENAYWEIDEYGTLIISGTGPMYDYELDATDLSTNAPWFESADYIYKIKVEEGISYIGDAAFASLHTSNIEIPNSVTEIGEYVLLNTSTKNITLPFIGRSKEDTTGFESTFAYLFGDMGKLAGQAGMPESQLEQMCTKAYHTYDGYTAETFDPTEKNAYTYVYSAGSIQSISVTNQITYSDFAFSGLSITSLVDISINLPNGSTYGNYFFYNSNIGYLTVPLNTLIQSHTFAGAQFGILFFDPNYQIDTFTNTMFDGTTCLALGMPKALKTIDGEGNDFDLSSPYNDGFFCLIKPDLKTFYELDYINGAKNFSSALYIDTPEEAGSVNAPSVIDHAIPAGTTKIGENGLSGSNISNITLPDSVTEIGQNAFNNCKQLQAINLDQVTTIGEGAFSGCTVLNNIKLNNSITELKKETFKGCSFLTDIQLPDALTDIFDGLFEGCISLSNIELSDDMQYIGNNAFKNTGLTSIKIPESVQKIGNYAFANSTSLTEVNGKNTIDEVLKTMPDTTISDNAFYNTGLVANEKSVGKIFSVEKDGLTVTVETDESKNRTPAMDDNNRLLYYTGETATTTINVSNPNGSTKEGDMIHITFNSDEDYRINIDEGNFNIEVGSTTYTGTVTKNDTGYCIDVPAPNSGDTISFSIGSSFASGTTGGGLALISAEIISKDGSSQVSDGRQFLTWGTKPDQYPVNKKIRDTWALTGSGKNDGISYINGLSYAISLERTGDTLEGIGEDPLTLITFTDTLTIPEGWYITDAVKSAIENNKLIYSNKEVTLGAQKLLQINTNNNIVINSISMSDDDTKLIVKWMSASANSYEYVLTYGDQLFATDEKLAKDQTIEINNDVEAKEIYTYSGSQIEKDTETATITAAAGSIDLTYELDIDTYNYSSKDHKAFVMGTDAPYVITLHNPGVTSSYVGKLSDALPRQFYISGDGIETMFNSSTGEVLQVTITNGTITTGNSIYDITGYDGGSHKTTIDDTWAGSKYEGLSQPSKESYTNDYASNNGVTITLTKGNDCIIMDYNSQKYTIGENGYYKSVKEALVAINFKNTYYTQYSLVWDFDSVDKEIYSGETIIISIPSIAKSTFMMLTKDALGLYYTDNYSSIDAARPSAQSNSTAQLKYANGNDNYKTSSVNNLYYFMDLSIDLEMYENGEQKDGTSPITEGTVSEYRNGIELVADQKMDQIPLVNQLEGSQVIMVPVNENKNADWTSNAEIYTTEDGVQYYLLSNEGTYSNVCVGTLRSYYKNNYANNIYKNPLDHSTLIADKITVENTDNGLKTTIHWYIEKLDDLNYDASENQPAFVNDPDKLYLCYYVLNSGKYSANNSNYYTNTAYLGDYQGHRLVDSFGGVSFDIEKNIVNNVGDTETKSNNSSIGEGDTITYRLSLYSTTDHISTVTGSEMSDILPLSIDSYRWTKDNVKISYSGFEDISDETEDAWTIMDAQGNTDQQNIKWNDDFKVSFNNPAYIWVTLTFPDDANWEKYLNTYGSTVLTNTFKVDGPTNLQKSVSHVLKQDTEAILQKGVYATGSISDTYKGNYKLKFNTGSNTRYYYPNSTSDKAFVAYYVVLYNDGNSNLYLTDMVDTLPEGYTFEYVATSRLDKNTIYNGSNFGYFRSIMYNSYVSMITPNSDKYTFATISDNQTSEVKYVPARVTADANHNKVTFSFPHNSLDTNVASYDETVGLSYLKPGESIQFAYVCSTDSYDKTQDISNNAIAMPVYNRTGGKISVGDSEINVYDTGADANDGGCSLISGEEALTKGFTDEANDTQWVMSDVNVYRGGIKPGLSKKLVSAESPSGLVTNNPIIVNPTDTLEWNVTSHNSGTNGIVDYTITDELPSPYIFSGDVYYNIYGSADKVIAKPLTSNDTELPLFTITNVEVDASGKAESMTIQYTSASGNRVETELTVGEETINADTKWNYRHNGTTLDGSYNLTTDADYRISAYYNDEGELQLSVEFLGDAMGIPTNGYGVLTLHTKNSTNTYINKTYTNTAYVTPNIQTWDGQVNIGNYEESGPTEALVDLPSVRNSAPFTVANGYATTSTKSVTDNENPTNTATSNSDKNYIVLEDATKEFTYTLTVDNVSDRTMDKLILIDNLPQVGDHDTFNPEEERESEFTVSLSENPSFVVTVAPDRSSASWEEHILKSDQYIIQYSTKTEFNTDDWAGTDTGWTTYEEGADLSEARSIRLIILDDEGTLIPANSSVRLSFTAKADESAKAGEYAWNSFGYHYSMYNSELELEAAPLEVGVAITGKPSIIKNVIDAKGNPATRDEDATYRFILYKGHYLSDIDDSSSLKDVAESLTEKGIEFSYIELNVPAGSTASEELSLADIYVYNYDDTNDFTVTDQQWTWDNDESYTLWEILDENYSFDNVSGGETINNAYTFTYTNSRNQTLECVNELIPHTFDIRVNKYYSETIGGTTYAGAVEGAVLQVWNADKSEMLAEQTVDKTGYVTFTELAAGNYVLVEAEAPEHFVIAEDIPFTVNKDGTITTENLENIETDEKGMFLKMKDKMEDGSIIIQKYEDDGETPLAGVTYNLYDSNDQLVDTKTTGEDGKVTFTEVPFGDYTIVETKTAEGYNLLAEPISVTIPLVMTADDAQANDADTTQAFYDKDTDSYIFFALTYNVTDDVTFVLPTTGSNNLAVMAMGGIGMLIVLAGGWLVYRRKRGYKGIINL